MSTPAEQALFLPNIDDSMLEMNIAPSRRQFETAGILFGLGGAAIFGYCVYKHLQKNQLGAYTDPNAQKTESTKPELKIPQLETSRVEVSDEGDTLFTQSGAALNKLNNNNEATRPATPAPQGPQIVLHQCPRGYLTPCIAPFPLKLETFLRVAGIPYEVDFSVSPDDGNVPWMTVNGDEIYESHECITKISEVFNVSLNSTAQNSRLIACRLVEIMLESHIYWGIALWRWVYDQGKSVPLIQPLSSAGVATIEDIGSSVNRAAYYHGLGRLSPKQVTDIILKDLGDLSSALGKHHYFLGEMPGEVDCGAFAMLAQMIWNMPGSPYEPGVKQYRNLVDFVLRMRDNFWPDWQNILQVRGKENFDGAAISPGSEFLHTHTATPASSNWDSKTESSVTVKEMSLSSCNPATPSQGTSYTARQVNMNVGPSLPSAPDSRMNSRAEALSKASLKSNTIADASSNTIVDAIPLKNKSSSRNPFVETLGDYINPQEVQAVPPGMMKPSAGPLFNPGNTHPQQYYNSTLPPPNVHTLEQAQNNVYAPNPYAGVRPAKDNNVSLNQQPHFGFEATSTSASQPLNHGNVIQRITEQNLNNNQNIIQFNQSQMQQPPQNGVYTEQQYNHQHPQPHQFSNDPVIRNVNVHMQQPLMQGYYHEAADNAPTQQRHSFQYPQPPPHSHQMQKQSLYYTTQTPPPTSQYMKHQPINLREHHQ